MLTNQESTYLEHRNFSSVLVVIMLMVHESLLKTHDFSRVLLRVRLHVLCLHHEVIELILQVGHEVLLSRERLAQFRLVI